MNGTELGEYVHYHAESYRNFGIGKSIPSSISPTSAYTTAKANIRQLAYQKNLSQQAKTLAKKLNDLRIDSLISPTDNYDQKVNDYVLTTLENSIPFAKIDSTSFDVIENMKFDSIFKLVKDGNLKKYKNAENGQYVYWGTLNNYRNQLNRLYRTLSKEVNDNNIKGLTPILNEIERIKKEILKIKREVKNDKTARIFFNDSNIDSTSIKKVIQDMNNLIGYIRAPKAVLLGEAGEYGTAALIALLADKINDTKVDFIDGIEEAVVGKNKSKTNFSNKIHNNGFINTEIFLSNTNIRKTKKGIQFYNNYTTDENGNVISVRGSQDTVDISVNINGSKLSKELGLNEINASIKNYSDAENKIKIISGTNLLSILTILYTPFINHYLNMITTHVEYNYKNNTRAKKLTDVDFQNQWENYNSLIKFTVAMRALSGIRNDVIDINKKNSDFFIVNDRTKKRFFVVDTYTLLKRIEKNVDDSMDFTSNSIPVFGRTQNKWVNANDRATGAERRITNIISKLHRRKISASLKPGVLVSTFSSL